MQFACRVIGCLGLVIGVSMSTGAVSAQGELPVSQPLLLEGARVSATLEGFVLGPDGSPAEGVVVVSSAGGRAVTGAAGRYRLEDQVPHDATRVQLTALAREGARSSGLHARIELPLSIGGVTRVEPIVLAGGPRARWLPTFGVTPEVDGSILALTVFDDGSGPALHAGGNFTSASGEAASRIAKWDGARWSPLGSGITGSSVYALTVFDDGSGPALYAGGEFGSAGGVAASNIARWDGSSWTPVGAGLSAAVYSLAVFDGGTGPTLHAGGAFVGGLRRWTGTGWNMVGPGGVNSHVRCLTVFDDGGGPALYAGGSFDQAGLMTVRQIARWNGSSWSALGSGLGGTAHALSVFDDGSGPALFVGGDFTSAGGASANRIARWDGSSWSALGNGLVGDSDAEAYALSVFDDGSGPALFVGGDFTSAGGAPANRIAKWDGAGWSAPGGRDSVVLALTVFDDGTGPALCAGGGSTGNDLGAPTPVNPIAKWEGTAWKGLNDGLDGEVRALTVLEDGGDAALHAGGTFRHSGALTVNRVARWEGGEWSPLGGGFPDFCVHDCEEAFVNALVGFDDGSGPALFAGAGGGDSSPVSRWSGSSWVPLSFTSGEARALTVFDDGSGPALHAGGFITIGLTVNHIAKWDGSAWSALGSGLNGPVQALAVFDDGSGAALYAGGAFTAAGGGAANHIARWDGSSWSPLAGGMNGPVHALAVFDDGSGPALYGGSSGGPHYFARWNGSSWSPVQGGMNAPVLALAVFDDGSGAALHAGGEFTTAGGLIVGRIAKWDGSDWSTLGAGLSGPVRALTVFDDGNGADLYVGGSFTRALGSGDSYLARWGCPPGPRARIR